MGLCLFSYRYPIKGRGNNFWPHSGLSEELYQGGRPLLRSSLQDVG
jgi:hypothetical protein